MGWFGTGSSPAAAPAAPAANSSMAAAPLVATTEGTSKADEAPRTAIATTPTPTAALPALSEAEQLDLIVAGARLGDTEAEEKATFLGSNQRHMYLDGALSCAVYTFSGLQHIRGQSNALTLLTMWTVGTTFLVDMAERKYLQEALQGILPNALSSTKKQDAEASGGALAAVQTNEYSEKQASIVTATAAGPPASALSAPLNPQKLAEQQRKVFMTQAVASWIWMLASFQQFKVHKRLKWCGYSSWMGLGCAGYYTTRHMYNMLVK